MHDQTTTPQKSALRIDSMVLRHLMHETINLLDMSSNHADEACESTDAAMALTRIDWMLTAILNWLSSELRDEAPEDKYKLGESVSIIGIQMDTVSPELFEYAQLADRLHIRVKQLESLIEATKQLQHKVQPPAPVENTPASNEHIPSSDENISALVLHIFGDPNPEEEIENAVLDTQERLNYAFATA